VVIFYNPKKPQQSLADIAFLLLVASGAYGVFAVIQLLWPQAAFADDGGKAEAGGSWAAWAKSEGAGTAAARCAVPAASSAAGAIAPPITPMIPPSQIPQGTEINGKVWAQPPWDEGGPYLMDKDEYTNMVNMQKQGYVWDRSLGWKTPEDMAQSKAQMEDWRQKNAEYDRQKNLKIQEEMRAIKAQQQAAAAERQRLIDIEAQKEK